MRRVCVPDHEERLERERQAKYRGTARIRLVHLQVDTSGHSSPDTATVKRLVEIFENEGCFHQDSRHHVPAVISYQHLDVAIQTTGISPAALLDNAQQEAVELQLPPDLQLQCLHGRHRLQAGREMRPSLKWWTADLYSDDLSTELRTYLAEELSNEQKPTDGEIYRKIRYHYLNPLASARWWACLTGNKQKELRRLLRREDFTAAFDALLPFPGLWRDGMRFGVTKAILGSKCDEENLLYLNLVKKFWAGLVHDGDGMQKVDYVTVKALELKAPSASTSDSIELYRQLRAGKIFAKFDLADRLKIWAKLQAWGGLVPTLWTFFEDFKYLEACAFWVRKLVQIPPRMTLYTAMARSFSEQERGRDQDRAREGSPAVTFGADDRLRRVELHYRHVFLYVMRHLRELSPQAIKMEASPHEDRHRPTKDPNETVIDGLASLASRLGFRSEKISSMRANYSSHPGSHPGIGRLKPVFVTDRHGEHLDRRCGCPYSRAHEESKELLFLSHMQSTDRVQGFGIHPLFVRRSMYQAFFGNSALESESALLEHDVGPDDGAQSVASRELGSPTIQTQRQNVGSLNPVESEMDLWESQRPAECQTIMVPRPLLQHDISALAAYDSPRADSPEVRSVQVPSPLDESQEDFHGDSPISPADSMLPEPPNEVLERRFRFVFRDGEHWTVTDELVGDLSTIGIQVERAARRHWREGRFLFDAHLWSLHPSDCLKAAVEDDSYVVLVMPHGTVMVNGMLCKSASDLMETYQPGSAQPGLTLVGS